ncbi:hypothetical protein DFH06DRAFT_1143795 [Mycena polygramma]|nr:hypothetical protein DFH06DRAFT_1143795 [Mycena polygramma]
MAHSLSPTSAWSPAAPMHKGHLTGSSRILPAGATFRGHAHSCLSARRTPLAQTRRAEPALGISTTGTSNSVSSRRSSECSARPTKTHMFPRGCQSRTSTAFACTGYPEAPPIAHRRLAAPVRRSAFQAVCSPTSTATSHPRAGRTTRTTRFILPRMTTVYTAGCIRPTDAHTLRAAYAPVSRARGANEARPRSQQRTTRDREMKERETEEGMRGGSSRGTSTRHAEASAALPIVARVHSDAPSRNAVGGVPRRSRVRIAAGSKQAAGTARSVHIRPSKAPGTQPTPSSSSPAITSCAPALPAICAYTTHTAQHTAPRSAMGLRKREENIKKGKEYALWDACIISNGRAWGAGVRASTNERISKTATGRIQKEVGIKMCVNGWNGGEVPTGVWGVSGRYAGGGGARGKEHRKETAISKGKGGGYYALGREGHDRRRAGRARLKGGKMMGTRGDTKE